MHFVIFLDSPMASSTSKCRGCLNKANSFCYVCVDFTTFAQRRTITSLLRTAYFHYFDCKIGDQDKSWDSHICCKPCYNGLTAIKILSTASTNGVCVGTSRSIVFSWVCKRASQSTVVSRIVELYPSITNRKTGGLKALLFPPNTASSRILWWT